MADEVSVRPVVIRRAVTSDEEAILAMAARMANFRLPRWRTAAEVIDGDGNDTVKAVRAPGPDHDVFVAEVDHTPAGCLYVLVATDFFGRRHAHVSVIVTSEAAEGTGVGRALMAHAEAWAAQRGLNLLTLNVFASNDRARRFYERNGFEVEMVRYGKEVTLNAER